MKIRVGYKKPRNPHVESMRFRKHGVHKKSIKSIRRKQKVEDKKDFGL